MSCFNFIIIKVNGADVSNLPYEEAVQLFLNAEEPIIVEVRRRCFDDGNTLSFFNYDTHKSPTLAVFATSNTPNSQNDGLDFCQNLRDTTPSLETIKHLHDNKPKIASISCQTELSAFDGNSRKSFFTKGDHYLKSGMFLRNKQEETFMSVNGEYDIEEIIFKKSHSSENLGFTISCSTEDFSESESSDEFNDECNERYGKNDEEYNLSGSARKCKIYVTDIVPNSLADRDGRLRQGDRIIQINGQKVFGNVDPNKLLTESKSTVTILVNRYAYTGDDEFLDSAVYCDDRECQDYRHLSSICECEQNTFSSKSSISQSENKALTPATIKNIEPIIHIADGISDVCHAKIKSQLESVNTEISLLNTQISVLKLQQSQIEHNLSVDKSSCKVENTALKSNTLPESRPNSLCPLNLETEIEHIYETIPGDTELDTYYCSPYEDGNGLRVKEWLKSIECTKANIQSLSNVARDKIKAESLVAFRLQKDNPSLDDNDNSSSAYNTGDSCNSALLPSDKQKIKPSPINIRKSKKHQSSKNVFHELNVSKPRKQRDDIADSSKQIQNTCHTTKPCVNQKHIMPSTPISLINNACFPTDVDSDSTLVARPNIYGMCHYKTAEQESSAEMVWKVKRRPDGSRYIVRRDAKKLSPSEKNPEYGPNADPDAYKRQVQKFKERRTRHQKSSPSKNKHDSQQWLV